MPYLTKEGLPEGWIAQWDEKYNTYFYVNEKSTDKTSTWEHPSGNKAAPPPPPYEPYPQGPPLNSNTRPADSSYGGNRPYNASPYPPVNYDNKPIYGNPPYPDSRQYGFGTAPCQYPPQQSYPQYSSPDPYAQNQPQYPAQQYQPQRPGQSNASRMGGMMPLVGGLALGGLAGGLVGHEIAEHHSQEMAYDQGYMDGAGYMDGGFGGDSFDGGFGGGF